MCRAIAVFLLALVGIVYPYNRGSLYTALVVIYALTSGIAGYTAASYYKMLDGANWVSSSFLQPTEMHLLGVTVDW
jgi:transmembrane 9 superfamily protein 1